ncbi:unnamed protein product [Paramecium sonneborni]|uniref:Uncharacterized protein n=1 Tax=Paramecium sonneborni TaxID=65129 RepID=A0A8S1P7C3_9CILI|nr:unnamed protein product [Paramecium sonneborni]
MKNHQQQFTLVESLNNQKKKKLLKESSIIKSNKEQLKKNNNTLQNKQEQAKQGENYYNFLIEEKKIQRQQLQSQGLMFSDQNLGLYIANEKQSINYGVMSRKRRNIKNIDSNLVFQKTSSKNESSVENDSISKIQKLKEKMNLVNESQLLVQDNDIMSSLQIKPIQSNFTNLYSPIKFPLKQKSTSQYIKKNEEGLLQSPIDNYILKKLEKIAEGNKEQQPIQQFSPERAQIRKIKKLLPIQSLTRQKYSFFGEMNQQRNSVDFQSEQCRDNNSLDYIKQQSNQQLSQIYNQLKQLSSNRYQSIKSIDIF